MGATADLREAGDMTDDGNERIDGRSLRRERNREAVITALLDMVREGNLDPGGAEIAERAGVSHRSIFRYFDDLGDLVRTAIAQEFSVAIPLGTIEHIGEGTLARRIDALVDSRIRLFDYVHGMATVARVRSLTIPEINEEFAEIADIFRTIMHTHFEPELANFPESDRDFVVDGALVLVSFDSYDLHHRLFSHGDEHIRRSWVTSLTALLTP